MIRLPAFIIFGCVLCAALILIELGSISGYRSLPGARLPAAEIKPAVPEIRKRADPLSSSTKPRPETASSADDAASPLRGVRLTGVVIGPDSRTAIFAVTGTNSRMLSEGDTLKGWRVDRISPKGVALSGAAGKMVLEPQPDANLVRPSLPVAVQSGQPDTAMTGVPGPPIAVTPIAVGNLAAATPVQTQGNPYYFPDYYSGYDPDYPWDWGSTIPWGWGWPVGVVGGCWNCGFRGGFFRPGFRRLGFGHPGFFQPGFGRVGFAHASFGGGWRGGARR
jgi:hypothetical protein